VRAYRNLPASIRDQWLLSAEVRSLSLSRTPRLACLTLFLVQAFGEREYLIYENERLTYADAQARAARLAALLHARGVKKGDRVAIAMRNIPEWAFSCVQLPLPLSRRRRGSCTVVKSASLTALLARRWWACQLLGAVAVAVNAWLTPEAFYHCVSITEPVAVVVDAERAEVLQSRTSDLRSLGCRTFLVARSASPLADFESFTDTLAAQASSKFPRPEILPEDEACIFFTSGTTSLPKGVLSTHRQYLSNMFNSACGGARALLRKGEPIPAPDLTAPQLSVLLVVPLFHAMGNHSFLGPVSAQGGKIVLMRKFSPQLGARLIVDEGVMAASGVPSQVSQLLEEIPLDAEGVKLETLSYGGGPPSSRLPEQLRARLPNALTAQGYGLTGAWLVLLVSLFRR